MTTSGVRASRRGLDVRAGVLFGGGSICFAAGSLPLVLASVPAVAVAWTFAIGSVLFTSGALLQYGEAAREPLQERVRRPAVLRWRSHGGDWWAAVVQLAGTICFNVSTFAATRSDLSLPAQKHLVWAPDVSGSICFLVASGIAYAGSHRGAPSGPDGVTSRRVATLNLAGSVAFAVSAVAARYVGGEPANTALVNLGTFAGAVAFLAGSVLLVLPPPGRAARGVTPR